MKGVRLILRLEVPGSGLILIHPDLEPFAATLDFDLSSSHTLRHRQLSNHKKQGRRMICCARSTPSRRAVCISIRRSPVR